MTATGAEVVTLSAQAWADRIRGHLVRSVENIIAAGRDLNSAKEDLGHGKFTAMVRDRLGWGMRAAEYLMAIAHHPVLSNPNHWAHLPPSYRTLGELARADEAVLLEAIADGKVTPDMPRWQASEIVKGSQPDLPVLGVLEAGPGAEFPEESGGETEVIEHHENEDDAEERGERRSLRLGDMAEPTEAELQEQRMNRAVYKFTAIIEALAWNVKNLGDVVHDEELWPLIQHDKRIEHAFNVHNMSDSAGKAVDLATIVKAAVEGRQP
jgi:hypothetical protein